MAVYVQTNQPINLTLNQAAYQVSAADTGKLFLLGVQGQALTITLPALASGLHYRFQVLAPVLGFNIIITSVAAIMNGLLCIAAANPAAVTASVSLTVTTAASLVGDFVDCYCDGVQWSLIAGSGAVGGITNP